MPYFRKSISAIMVLLIVMGCAGLTAFHATGDKTAYSMVAYYSAADDADGLFGSVVNTAQTLFSPAPGPASDTYVDAGRHGTGEYMAMFFDGQMITVPQFRGDSYDRYGQVSRFVSMQLGRRTTPAKQKALPTPLHLTTKEKVELLM